MKISVQFEADSAAEYEDIIKALRTIQVVSSPTLDYPERIQESAIAFEKWTEAVEEITRLKEELKVAREPAPVKTVEPLPVEPPLTPEPVPAETVVEAPEPPVKRRPGRPKMKPIVEEPEEEPEPVKATVTESKPVIESKANGLTHLDVKGAFRDYVIRYGTSNGYSDVPQLLTKAFGTEIRKAEHVPNDQSSLKKAIGIIIQALNDNPFNRKVANA